MKRLGLIVAGVLIVGGIFDAFALPPLANSVNTQDLNQTFYEQTNILAGRITILAGGISSTTKLECVVDKRTYTQTQTLCIDEVAYHNHNQLGPVTAAQQQAYPANAANLDSILKANGWVNDRPTDAFQTFVSINPYSAGNGGVGGALAFHKNVGGISCNLRAMYQGVVGASDPKGTFEINQFSCQKTFTYPALHLRMYQNFNV